MYGRLAEVHENTEAMAIPSNAATTDHSFGTFIVRKTASEVFSFYRVG